MSLNQTALTIERELRDQFPQRADAIEVLTLALLSKSHAFLLGPPGTAKSALVREFVGRFHGATYFETVLSRNRPDQAVLGPYDMNELRECSNFVRKDDGFLTTVDIAFLDEIGKSSPTLGHDLLAALNERVKHQVAGGRSAHQIPLWSAFTASNELPAAESEDAAALWDRLLLRAQVDYLDDSSAFQAMLTAEPPKIVTSVPFTAIRDAYPTIQAIKVTQEALDGIVNVRHALRNEGLVFSDRRWKEGLKVVRGVAWLRGSPQVDVEDLEAYRHVLWETPDQRAKVLRVLLNNVSPDFREVLNLEDLTAEVEAMFSALEGRPRAEIFTPFSEANVKLKSIRDRGARIAKKVKSPRALDRLAQVDARVVRLKEVQGKLAGIVLPGLDD